jgi:hypothetical protein
MVEQEYHGARYGVYYTDYLKEFNANNDFPWETTFGLSQAFKDKTHDAINFIYLPKPIVIINERPIKWIFPIGTVVAEMIYVLDGNTKRVFEIRTREKVLEEGGTTWEPRIYRPFANAEELQYTLRLPTTNKGKKHLFLRNPEEDEVFEIHGNVEIIPDLTPNQTRFGLRKPFQDVTNSWWSKERDSFAPMSNQSFSVFPKDYAVGLLKSVDSSSCSDCHRQTQISVLNLIPNDKNIQRNFKSVGNIRGSDGVFTWYPFDKKVIGQHKNFQQNIPLREIDFEKGYVQWFDSEIHRYGDYQLTSYVIDSLKDWELPVRYREKKTSFGENNVRYYNLYDKYKGYFTPYEQFNPQQTYK